NRPGIEDDPDLGVVGLTSKHVDRKAVREQDVMRGGDRGTRVRSTRRLEAEGVSEPGRAVGLVVGHPVPDPIAEPAGDEPRLLDERLRRGTPGPPTLVLARPRGGPGRERPGAEPVVEGQAALVHPATPVGQDTRPRDREPVSVEAELLHAGDVLWVAVVRIARDRAGVAVSDLARR